MCICLGVSFGKAPLCLVFRVGYGCCMCNTAREMLVGCATMVPLMGLGMLHSTQVSGLVK